MTSVPGVVRDMSRDLYHILRLTHGDVHAKYGTQAGSRDLANFDFWSKNRIFSKKWPNRTGNKR